MLKKAFKFDLKSLSDEGEFEGYLSVFGNRDTYEDVVEKGAFKRTLQHKAQAGKKFPVLWQHDMTQPIGVFEELREDDHGLWVKGRLTMEVQKAKEAYALMQSGALDGLSIGFDIVKKSFKDGIRYLKELKLWEGSLVTFPANDMATVTAIKSAFLARAVQKRMGKAVDFAGALAEIQDRQELSRLRSDIMRAFEETVFEVMWGWEQDADERLAALDASMDDLKTALMSWARRYLELPEDGSKGHAPGLKSDNDLPDSLRSPLSAILNLIKPLLGEAPAAADPAPSAEVITSATGGHSEGEGAGPGPGDPSLSDSDIDLHSLDFSFLKEITSEFTPDTTEVNT